MVATAGAGGDFVETDEIQPTDEVQRLTISPASSPWECQANMAPTPTKAVMEKSRMVRDVRPRIEDGRGNTRIDDSIAFNPAEKSDLSLAISICWKNASCPVFGSRGNSLDAAFSAVRHSFSSATSLPAAPPAP